MFANDLSLADFDPELASAMADEAQRQEDHLELIASENYASPLVMQAQGSVLTNKYAEGYPGRRYYGGCEYVDRAEELAIARAKALFGGHLTHGAKPNFSGKTYHSVQYGLNPATGEVDYDRVADLAREHRPRVVVAGFSAYSRIMDWSRFRTIADEVGAWLMVDMAHVAGLVAAGCYPNPVPVADVVTSTTHKTLRGPRGGLILARANAELEKKLDSAVFPGQQGGPLMHVIAAKAVCFKEAESESYRTYQRQVVGNARAMAATFVERGIRIVSGGTDNHLMLVDLIGKPYTGKEADEALGRAHITVNKNAVPGDPRSPFVTSGLRVGTPAITTRGFREAETVELTHWICDLLAALEAGAADAVIGEVRAKVEAVCARFPVYG